MKTLSKYQLKQLSPAQRADYENELYREDHNTTVCHGGKVVISQDDEGVWIIEAFDDDDSRVEDRWGDTRDEVEQWLEDFVDSLAEYAEEQQNNG